MTPVAAPRFAGGLTGLVVAVTVVFAVGCSDRKAGTEPPPTAEPATAAPAPAAPADAGPGPAVSEEPLPQVPSPYDALPESARGKLDEVFKGDLDEMVKRRVIRVGVTYSRTHYFTEKGQQRGITYESLMNFEEALNKRLKTGNLRVFVAFVPLPRDMLLPALVEGKLDLVAAMLTVTPERQKLVDFTSPTRTGVNEIVVTGPGAPPIRSVDDLSGQTVFVRKTSSYFGSLTALNEQLTARGKAPAIIKLAPETLEDDDILEMVNAGLVPATVVDDYLAEFWAQIFPHLTLHADVALHTGGVIAVAVRRDSPKLKQAANQWIEKYGERTAFSNVLRQRYLRDTDYARDATSAAEREKFLDMVNLFRKYGGQYDLDPILMAAQGYQESRLDQGVRSKVGAIGVMQVMPATGREQGVGDITQLEPNIHAGIKYMRFMINQYYKDEPMTNLNKALMTFASYNAGPARVRQLRAEARKRGLDPNVWFGNVERMASEKVGRETVQYVGNIYKYYVAYTLVIDQLEAKGKGPLGKKATK